MQQHVNVELSVCSVGKFKVTIISSYFFFVKGPAADAIDAP
jgi:hypothetical protein